MSHDHDHDHDEGHDHAHAPQDFGRAFILGMSLQGGFIVLEVIYGMSAHSMALLADAGHNLSDVLGLALAWGAAVLAKRKASAERTYGMRRASILAALFNSLSLVFVTGGVAWESVERLREPLAVGSRALIVVATMGVAVNGLSAALFLSGRGRDLNIRAAFLHLASDALISLGVALTGVVILFTAWTWLDPAVSLAVSLAVLASTWSLLRRALNLALDAVPEGIDVEKVLVYLLALPGVSAVHDLHVWGMSTTETVLTAHIVMPGRGGDDAFQSRVARELNATFRIHHTTLQIEAGNHDPCALASEDVV